jgi:hypothetical protein
MRGRHRLGGHTTERFDQHHAFGIETSGRVDDGRKRLGNGDHDGSVTARGDVTQRWTGARPWVRAIAMRWLVVVVLAASVVGCTTARVPSPATSYLTVFEFDTTQARVSGYESPSQALGLALASEVATGLRERGRAAEFAPASAPTPYGGIVIRGRITAIDSAGRRGGIVGPTGPLASCACDGVVATSEGATITSFRDEERASGTDDDPSEGPVQKCLQSLGRRVATMIDLGMRP